MDFSLSDCGSFVQNCYLEMSLKLSCFFCFVLFFKFSKASGYFPPLNNSPKTQCNCFIILSDLQCAEWIVYIVCRVPRKVKKKNIEDLCDTVIECHMSVHFLECSSSSLLPCVAVT